MALATSTVLIIAAGVAVAGTAYSVREQNMATKSAMTAQGQQVTAEAEQLKLQAQAERTQAEADELERQRTLQRIMQAQDAVFGSTGLVSSGGSFEAIQTKDTQRAAEATRLNRVFEDTRQVGFSGNIQNLQNQFAYNRQAAKYARRTNTIKGGLSAIKTGLNAYAGAQ